MTPSNNALASGVYVSTGGGQSKWVDPTRFIIYRDQESQVAQHKINLVWEDFKTLLKDFGRDGGGLRTVVFHERCGLIDLPRCPTIFPSLLERVPERLEVFCPVGEPHVHDDSQTVFGAPFR